MSAVLYKPLGLPCRAYAPLSRWAVRVLQPARARPREEASLTHKPGRGCLPGRSARRSAGASLRRRAGCARRDLVAIMAAARYRRPLHRLITSAVGIALDTLKQARRSRPRSRADIRSGEDSERASADRIAGYEGAFARKCALAAEVVRLKIPLTVNAVMHRANIDHIEDMVALALALGASRVEIAHVQYYGWALKNRASLMPSAEQAKRAAATVEDLRRRHHGKIVIDAVVPDYYAQFPKPCVGGWGRRSLNVTPAAN